MNTGDPEEPAHYSQLDWFSSLIKNNGNLALVIVILTSLASLLVCCLCQEFFRGRRRRQEEEEEMRIINEMIANSEAAAIDSSNMYRPEPITPLLPPQAGVSCSYTLPSYPQLPSYDSIVKENAVEETVPAPPPEEEAEEEDITPPPSYDNLYSNRSASPGD